MQPWYIPRLTLHHSFFSANSKLPGQHSSRHTSILTNRRQCNFPQWDTQFPQIQSLLSENRPKKPAKHTVNNPFWLTTTQRPLRSFCTLLAPRWGQEPSSAFIAAFWNCNPRGSPGCHHTWTWCTQPPAPGRGPIWRLLPVPWHFTNSSSHQFNAQLYHLQISLLCLST